MSRFAGVDEVMETGMVEWLCISIIIIELICLWVIVKYG